MKNINIKNIMTPLEYLIDMRNQLNNKLEYMNKYYHQYSDEDREYVISHLLAYDKSIQNVKIVSK